MEPNAFVVVGETDWLSTQFRDVAIAYDSRLRGVAIPTANGSDFRAGYAENGRTFSSSDRRYFEFLITGATLQIFGVSADRSVTSASIIDTLQPAAGVGMTLGRTYKSNATFQSGLPTTSAVGDYVGVEVAGTSTGVNVQFYRNGVAYGNPVDLVATELWVGWSTLLTTAAARLLVDRHELRYLPANAQPWGASARVADRSGYSPEASRLTSTGSNYTIDNFGRTITGTADASGYGISANRVNQQPRSGILYYEALIETDAGALGDVGLSARGVDNTSSGTFPGSVSTSWGFRIQNGNKLNAGAGSAYGASTATAGDRIGVLWEPSSGKLYWSINKIVQGSGDPQAGTNAAFTNVNGDLLPAIRPAQGRIRLCTHAREQIYRPSYAEAWDGADLLPEQFFDGAIPADGTPSIRRQIQFQQWERAARPNRLQPIGKLKLINTDGVYDYLGEYMLRDQPIVAYRRGQTQMGEPDTVRKAWTGVIDSVLDPTFSTVEISIMDTTAKLDVRVPSPVFALGAPELIPVHSRIGTTTTYDVCQFNASSFLVYDSAQKETDWERDDTADFSGYTRTDSAFGKQSVRDIAVLNVLSEFNVLNADFSAWTAGAPDNWTAYAVNGGAVTQNGSAAVLSVQALPLSFANVSQNQTFASGRTYSLRFRVNAFTAPGFVTLRFNVGSDAVGIFGPGVNPPALGEHVVFLTTTGAGTNFAISMSDATVGAASIEITNVEVFEVTETQSVYDAIPYLLEALGGFSASEYNLPAAPSPYSPGLIGYWSDKRPSIREVLNEICDSLFLDYYLDAEGVLQFVWMQNPVEMGAESFVFTDGELSNVENPISRMPDLAPNLSTVFEYQRNYAKHSDEQVAGAVGAADRQYFTSDRRENVLDISSISGADAGPLHPFYNFAYEAAPMPRIVVNEFTDNNSPSNGSLTIDNRAILMQRCYGERKFFYVMRVPIATIEANNISPGKSYLFEIQRYDLSGGVYLMVIAVEAAAIGTDATIIAWGE